MTPPEFLEPTLTFSEQDFRSSSPILWDSATCYTGNKYGLDLVPRPISEPLPLLEDALLLSVSLIYRGPQLGILVPTFSPDFSDALRLQHELSEADSLGISPSYCRSHLHLPGFDLNHFHEFSVDCIAPHILHLLYLLRVLLS